LRVYLERPWFSSGDGELLGVVTSAVLRDRFDKSINIFNDGSLDQAWATDKLRVSHWGADPIWSVHDPVTKLRSDDIQAEGEPINARWNSEQNDLLEVTDAAPRDVQVAIFDVQFDPARQQWFADIEFDNTLTYFPFVRLAVVRYQPNSLAGQHFSDVTMCDFVQLPPNRILLCRPERLPFFSGGVLEYRRVYWGNTLTLQLNGASYTGQADTSTGNVTAGTSVVRARLQSRSVNAYSDPYIGWQDDSQLITLQASREPQSVAIQEWRGPIVTPSEPVNDNDKEYQVVVEEFEVFTKWEPEFREGEPTERLTYVETFKLPRSQQQ
jgi:hypothetical protein